MLSFLPSQTARSRTAVPTQNCELSGKLGDFSLVPVSQPSIAGTRACRLGDVKSLSGREGARLRVADWRVIFTEDPTTSIVVAVGHRGEIYED